MSDSNGPRPEFERTEVVEFRPDGSFQRRYYYNRPPHPDWACSYEYDRDNGQLLAERVEQDGIVTLVRLREYDSSRRLSRVMESGNNGQQRVSETYSYENGVKRKVVHLSVRADGYGVEGTDVAYAAPDAATITTICDEYGKPVEHHFHDNAGNLVTRVDLCYDDRGNLIEEICTNQQFPAAMATILGAEQLDAIRKLSLFGRRHRYDAQDRRIETSLKLFPDDFENKTFAYNDYGDVVSEISEGSNLDYEWSEEGTLHAKAESARAHRSETRIRYQYDSNGNWIEKIVESPGGPIWSIERRTITYFEADLTR